MAIEPATDRCSDDESTLGEDILNGFGQNEEKGVGVGAHTIGSSHVEEFHILAVIEAVVESLHFVVDACTNRSMIHGNA